jgi:mono/diheme cytochrome c family protein
VRAGWLAGFAAALCAGAAGWTYAAPVGASDPRLAAIGDIDQAHADFVEHCAGCHGVRGNSAPAALPELQGRVGWFMCTAPSRAYLIRLPNVAHSRISDNAQLADMLNYMVFVVGGSSAPAHAQPFTAQDVARERAHPLVSGSLTAERRHHALDAIKRCGAPASLLLNYEGENKKRG